MDKQNIPTTDKEKEGTDASTTYLTNKILGTNIFENLKKSVQEERERNEQKVEELSRWIEKIKVDFDEKIAHLNKTTETNFQELKYFVEQLNKNISNINNEIPYFKEDIQNIKNQILELNKREQENVEKAKTGTKTLFEKIKPMLSILNERMENAKEDFSKYKEANDMENKQKNADILKLISDVSETLNEKRKADVNVIHDSIKHLKEYLMNFQRDVEKNTKDIENKIEQNKKNLHDKINELQTVQNKMINDIYSSFQNTNA